MVVIQGEPVLNVIGKRYWLLLNLSLMTTPNIECGLFHSSLAASETLSAITVNGAALKSVANALALYSVHQEQ